MTAYDEIRVIKSKLMTGEITYNEARREAKPIIDRMNQKGSEIAKKYKQRFRPVSFTGLMR